MAAKNEQPASQGLLLALVEMQLLELKLRRDDADMRNNQAHVTMLNPVIERVSATLRKESL